jgi:eukaryotic-like serine/threonine-protein kinase
VSIGSGSPREAHQAQGTSSPLSPGERLGPYEIVAQIGSGGMGEVYRAFDARLHRDVALKIIHPALAVTPEHVDRFSREARAAGSLNHPNIVVVYDVGVEGGIPYVISELLEGESLRERLDRGPIPYRKALDYGIQMAQALGAAHAAGIWHRDIKPANTFITGDGRIKILDFGLAKLREGDKASRGQVEAGTDDSTAEATGPGMIRGTAGYMSPEQARGQRIDHRTDIFSLGAVLYEMFTGVRAFQRESTVETLHAIIRDDPVDPLEINRGLPPAAAVTVRRCLEKSVEERFQSARDLGFQLQQLREGTLPTRAIDAIDASFRRRALMGTLVVAAIAAAIALGLYVWPASAPASFEQLTFRRGRIDGARFAGEGQAVVYSEAGERNRRQVWRLDPSESPKSLHLAQYDGTDVLATRKGEIALSVDRRFIGGRHFVGKLATAPIDGNGRPRELRPDVEDADWDPSGTQLAAVFSSGTGGESRLESPLGHVLRTARSIRSPRFSRDGRRSAFFEDSSGAGIVGQVAVVDLEGHYQALTEVWNNARGIAWSPRGDEVWFTAGGWSADRALRAVDLRGRQRLVSTAPSSLTLWDIAADGRVLLTRDEEERGLVGVPPGQTDERDLSLYDSSGLASLSADGRSVLFSDRFGLYLRSTDGSAPQMDLGFGQAFANDLSPDGNWALVTTSLPSRLVIIPKGAGDPRELPTNGIATYSGALWFPDGRRITFNGAKPGEQGRAYVMDLDGGGMRALTPQNVKAMAISPDGSWVAAERVAGTSPDAPPGVSLWPVAGGPPRGVAGSQDDDRAVGWTDDGKSLWVFRWTEVPADVYRLEIATGRRERVLTLMPRDTTGVESILTFRTTRDGRAYFYTYRRVLSKLYLARNLR